MCFRKKLTPSQLNWNKLWKNYGKENNEINTLMNYYSEVFNGGHLQFFLNNEDGVLPFETINQYLNQLLPSNMYDNYLKAYNLYTSLDLNVQSVEDYLEVEMEENFNVYDMYLYNNEPALVDIMQEYADRLYGNNKKES